MQIRMCPPIARLTRELLQILLVQGSNNITNLDQLQALLMENLCSNKFLLAMEDVWDDADRQKWNMLCGPLEFGKPGSRILLTTRLDTVVSMVGKTIDVLDCSIKLKVLSKVEYLSLFNKCAFDDEEHSDHLNLAEIEKQIAGKLEGSPLAAKSVASLLLLSASLFLRDSNDHSPKCNDIRTRCGPMLWRPVYMLPYFCEVRMVTPRNGMISEPGVGRCWEWDADSYFENEWYTHWIGSFVSAK